MILDILFRRRKVYKLRKKYDRVREKADKMRDRTRKLQVLKALDHVESSLIMLEEQDFGRYDKKRLFNLIQYGINEAKALMEKENPRK